MNDPSNKAIESMAAVLCGSLPDSLDPGSDLGIARDALAVVYPIIRSDLAKDPEFLTMICGQAAEDLRRDVIAEVIEALHGSDLQRESWVWAVDFLERTFGKES